MDTRKYFQRYGVDGVKERIMNKTLSPSKLNWHLISGWIQTNDDFKRVCKDYLYWDIVCNAWEMSDQFMFEMKDYIDPTMYANYNNASDQFYYFFKNKIDWQQIKISKLSNQLKSRLKEYYNKLFE